MGIRGWIRIMAPAVVLGVSLVQAAPEENADEKIGGEHSMRAPASARNGVSRKRYPGGADEDDLQVQATLPIPSRTFDGTMPTSTSESPTNDSANPPPAND